MKDIERPIIGGVIVGLTADCLEKEDHKEEPKPEEAKPVKKRASVKK